MRAKFYVESVTNHAHGSQEVKLSAVYGTSDKDNEENNQFAAATPGGTITMFVDNENAKDYLEPGAEYYVDFTKAPKRN